MPSIQQHQHFHLIEIITLILHDSLETKKDF